ncbi:MAG TPA: hydrogenase maturation nickel metallochaperone HypA [Bacteroidetes bacterium]|jgi:hydrogenase nickel incorporation protein HypA/HybF|nr:hydrogenase maturation nickel metallochaperone HypA [Bacteroidota bacterium]
MHELSIAMGIVELAEREAKKAGGNDIESIELEIGKLSGIEMEALDFAWPVATKGTMLENASMNVESPAGRARCLECDFEFDVENLYDSCPKCNSYFKDIFQGKELRIKSIVIKD